jgi:ABC-2 type transport system permease protein
MFELVQASGWQGGLRNLLRADFGKWFGTSLWWTQGLIWILVIDGILAGVLWSGGEDSSAVNGITLYCIFSALFPAIAAVIILQDAIVGEREAGTAAWVLSKPVSRTAFVLSKLFPNLVGVLVSMLLLPGAVAYAQLSAAQGSPLDPLRFLAGLGVLWIYISYYLTLTLMLGTFFTHRAPVIGIPLALAFGQQMLFGLLPFLLKVLPWSVAIPVGQSDRSIVSAIMLGQPLPDITPLVVTSLSILVFVAVAILRVEREEF